MTELPQANWKKKTRLRWSKKLKRPQNKFKNSDKNNETRQNYRSYTVF